MSDPMHTDMNGVQTSDLNSVTNRVRACAHFEQLSPAKDAVLGSREFGNPQIQMVHQPTASMSVARLLGVVPPRSVPPA